MVILESKRHFDSISKGLHWILAILFIVQFYLVYRREYFPKEAPEKLQYILLHKSIGMTILDLGILFILWRLINKRPPLPDNLSVLERCLAHVTHKSLFFCMIAMPVTGYLMSTAGGHPTSFYGLFTLPALFAKNKALSHFFHSIHVWLSYAVIGLFFLHLLATLKHHFILKDDTLRRMLPGRRLG